MNDDLVNLVKAVGRQDLPSAFLAVWGVYGGQYAARFAEPYRGAASILCLLGMIIGGGALALRAIARLRPWGHR